MGKGEPPSEENQALVANARKGKGRRFPSQKRKGKRINSSRERKQLDMSKVKYFNCQKFGHFARYFLKKSKRFGGRQLASTVDIDDEPQRKKTKESDLDQVTKDIRKEYYLISVLFGSITCSGETSLVDSDASRHMTGYQSALTNLTEKKSSVHVELGDDATYAIQGVGSTSFRLDSRIILHIEAILFVPGLKKNLLSISALEDKGFRVTLMDDKALMWPIIPHFNRHMWHHIFATFFNNISVLSDHGYIGSYLT